MVSLLITLLMLALTGALLLQNLGAVPIHLLGADWQVPGSILVVLGLLAGYWFTSLWHRLRYLDFQRTIRECGRTIAKQNRRIEELEHQLKEPQTAGSAVADQPAAGPDPGGSKPVDS